MANIKPCLVLVHPRKTRPHMTEKKVDWDVKNQIKQTKLLQKILSGTLIACQAVWNQIGTDRMFAKVNK